MKDDASDPAIERVRAEVAHLGRDDASAPAVPAEVTARVGAALRAARPPAHTVERPRLGRGQRLGLVLGLTAAGAGVAVGLPMLADQPVSPPAPGPTAERITVSRPSPGFPLSQPQLAGLLAAPPDYGSPAGALSDPARRAACLDTLGYPGADVLGAAPLDMAGRPAVVLLLPGRTTATVDAVVVEPSCRAPLADTVVRRP